MMFIRRKLEPLASYQGLSIEGTDQFSITVTSCPGIRTRTFMIIPTRAARLAAFGIRHLPRLTRWLGDRTIAAAQRTGS
jgi:hypothetical protein